MSASEPGTVTAKCGAAATGVSSTDAMPTSLVVLPVLFVVYFLSSIDRSIFNILAQPIKEELLLADWQVGFLTGFAFSGIYLVFGLVMARLADQRNRVNILSVCVAFWSVMTALCGLSANFLQLSLFRMGVGVGEAGCIPASHSLISDYFPPEQRTKALAIYGLGYPAGGLLGTIIGGIVLDHWGWRAAFYVVGLPGILMALLTWRIVKEPQRGRHDNGGLDDPNFADSKSFREVSLILWRSPVLRQMLLGLTLLSFFMSPTGFFLGAYLLRRFPISYTQLGFIVAMTMMLGASISTFVGGIIAQRLSRRHERWLLWFPAITVAAGMPLYVIALAQSNWVSLAIWLFCGALLNAAFLAPCFTVLYNSVPPGGRGKAAAIAQILIVLVGQSFGPLLAGGTIDALAGLLFGDHASQGFLVACPGGQAVQGASAALNAACHETMADATQIVLMATMVMTIWPSWHFFLAGRRMKQHPSASSE